MPRQVCNLVNILALSVHHNSLCRLSTREYDEKEVSHCGLEYSEFRGFRF